MNLSICSKIRSQRKLKKLFEDYFYKKELKIEGQWFCEKLNLRLGSHFGLGNGPNLYPKV